MAVDLQDLSRRLFATANQLWTNSTLRPDQYAQPVLALIALRQMEAKFDAVHADLAPTFTGRLKPTPADYQAKGAIFLPDNARFSGLLKLPENESLAAALDAAMKGIAETNPDLVGVLPQGYGALPDAVLRELLRLLAPLKIEGDAYGLIFEYFMGQFASAYMQKGGEYFTPASIVKLIVEVIEPYRGTNVGLEHIPRPSATLDAFGRTDEVASLKLRFRRGDILFGKIRPDFHKVAWAPSAGSRHRRPSFIARSGTGTGR